MKTKNPKRAVSKSIRPLTIYCESSFVESIEREAELENRKISPMSRLLIQEALTARAAKRAK